MSSYDFSPTYHSSVLAFSPGSTFIATAYIDRIVIRSTSTLQIVRTWHCLPSSPSTSKSAEIQLSSLSWSSDGLYILAHAVKSGSAWVFCLTDEGNGDSGEVAKIGAGVEGMIGIEWGKGSRDILVWSDYGIKLTIYDLLTGRARIIQTPKSNTGCHTYSPDGRYMAIAERHSGKDFVGVYDVAAGYQLLRHFALQTTDVQGLIWSPCGSYLAAYDSSLSFSIHIHSPLGPHLSHFSSDSPTFSPACAEDPGLGIRSVIWAPGGRYVATGGWDGKVRILESEGWRCIANIGFPGKVADKEVAVWKEPTDWITETRGRGIVQFNRLPLPASLPTTRADFTRYPPRAGISQVSFSPQASHFLTRLDTQPNTVHIHSFLDSLTSGSGTLQINHVASLVFASPVKSARWNPDADSEGKGCRVAICTRGGAVYIWDGEMGWVEEGEEEKGGLMEGVGIPTRSDFAAHDVRYSPDGTLLAIADKTQFCIMSEVHEGDDTNGGDGDRTVNASWRGWDEGLSHVVEEEEEGSFNWGRGVLA